MINDQEDIFKFRTDHYREHGFNSIHNRQPTPYVQCYQNVSSTASPPKSLTSPVYSPITKESTNSSSTSSDDSTDDSDEDSTSSSDDEESSPMRSALDEILDL